MTKEEAREAVKEAYGNSEYTDEIIKALEQEPCEDVVSRTEVLNLVRFNAFHVKSQIKAIENMPSVTPQEPTLDKIRAEIEEQVLESLSDGGDDWFTAEKVNECLDIIDKYRTGSEGKK